MLVLMTLIFPLVLKFSCGFEHWTLDINKRNFCIIGNKSPSVDRYCHGQLTLEHEHHNFHKAKVVVGLVEVTNIFSNLYWKGFDLIFLRQKDTHIFEFKENETRVTGFYGDTWNILSNLHNFT